MQARLALCCYFTYYFTTLMQEGRGDTGGSVIVRADVDEGAPFSSLYYFTAAPLLFLSLCAAVWFRGSAAAGRPCLDAGALPSLLLYCSCAFGSALL